MPKDQTKKILIDIVTGLVLAGVLIAAYFAFSSSKTIIPGIVKSSTATADKVVTTGAEVADTVQNLKDLNRSVAKFSAVFELPAFASLQDFSVDIVPEAVGRSNPFLPTDWKLAQKAK